MLFFQYVFNFWTQFTQIFQNTLFFGVLTIMFSKLFNNYHLFQIVFLMKNRKSKRRQPQQSPYSKPITSSTTSKFNIKFDFTMSNLSCFIGQKRQTKKTLLKRSLSHKMRKQSQKKKPLAPTKQKSPQKKSEEQKRTELSPDIIREASNSILNQIEKKGINHDWKGPQNNLQQNGSHQSESQNSQIWSVFPTNQSILKSYASTVDFQQPMSVTYQQQLYYHSVDFPTQAYSYECQQRTTTYESNLFQVRVDNIGYDPRTTIMIRNIPNKYTLKDLSQQIDSQFENTYDFLYLPCDLKNQCNMGYGFINFVDTAYLRGFFERFHNQKWAKFRSQKICILSYARLQGLTSLIQHFEHSKVLNQKQKRFRPIIKQNSKINNLIKTQQQK